MNTRMHLTIPKIWQKRLLLIMLLILVCLVGMRAGFKRASEALASAPVQTVYVEVAPQRSDGALAEDAGAVAKVLYGMRNNSKEDLRGVINVLVNRAESPMFQASLIEVCEEPYQWVGYYDTNTVTESLYNLAYDTLKAWRDGEPRMLDSDYFWFDWTPTQITFRNTYDKGVTTKYYTTGG